MKSTSRRYEVLLPVRFNDKSDVPEDLLGDAFNEVVEHFGAASFFKEAVEGRWRHGETLYRDDLALLVVDVPDTAKNRKWIKAYKARWKKRLEQLELWMISYPIDIE
jgi:hypothetical protein